MAKPKPKKSPAPPLTTLEAYRAAIPPEVREDILNKLLEARSRSFGDFIDMTTYIMAHTLAGNIPAEVAETMKGYLEMLFTATSAHQLTTKGTDGKTKVTAEGVALARAAGRKKLEGRVELVETVDGLKVKVGVVPVEQEEI